MQETRKMMTDELSNPKLRKKKPLSEVASPFQVQAETKFRQETVPSKSQRVLKRGLRTEASPVLQQTERSTSDSLTDSGSEYRSLRRKYLLLEEESFVLGREMSEVEAEVKTLEDEKFALLDQLVVLEGLIDPSELQRHGGL